MKNVYLLEVDFGNFVITLLCRHIYSRRDGASIGGANPSKQEPEIRHSVTVCWLTAKILSYPTCSEFDGEVCRRRRSYAVGPDHPDLHRGRHIGRGAAPGRAHGHGSCTQYHQVEKVMVMTMVSVY